MSAYNVLDVHGTDRCAEYMHSFMQAYLANPARVQYMYLDLTRSNFVVQIRPVTSGPAVTASAEQDGRHGREQHEQAA